MSELVNKNIGRYQIKELIGEGAMASVYRVYDPEINRNLALKILKSDFNVDDEYLSRFMREAKAAGALTHSNIVTVYDVGKFEGCPYILMELLNYGDLKQLLVEKKTLSVKETLIIALQLAKALHYAHEAGIVHRDIKPDNIMMMEDQVSIKVADFGIARISESEEAQKTQVGSVLGTPRYMSPEQALGHDIDGRTDLYSVGVLLYEMLSGEKAFDAPNLGTLMTQIIQNQPPSLKQLNPKLPSGLCQIVQKLIHKKPEKRFQSGADLAAAISKELTICQEQEEEQKRNKYMPLKVRWSLSMSAIVALVMLICTSAVFNIQTKAMSKQAIDSGASFAKFVAVETAIPLLSEDWISLETLIAEASNRQTFVYLIVTDRNGIVRGASDVAMIGQEYQETRSSEVLSEKNDIRTSSIDLESGNKVFNINAPVLFQDVKVGEITIGLSQRGLEEVKGMTSWLMLMLALITVLSVSIMLYVFGALITKPLKKINESLRVFGEGNFDTRVSASRNDEIGEIIESFNTMANQIQTKLTHFDTPLEDNDNSLIGVGNVEKEENTVTNKAEGDVKPSSSKSFTQEPKRQASVRESSSLKANPATAEKSDVNTPNQQKTTSSPKTEDVDKTIIKPARAESKTDKAFELKGGTLQDKQSNMDETVILKKTKIDKNEEKKN